MQESSQKKLAEILKINNEIARLNQRLEELLSEKQVVLPSDFSLNDEVLRVLQGTGENGMQTKQIAQVLNQKFPNYGIDRKKVASTLAYLKNIKKKIDLIGRSTYKAMGSTKSEMKLSELLEEK